MKPSMLPILLLIQIVAILAAVWLARHPNRGTRRISNKQSLSVLMLVITWAVVSILLGVTGRFQNEIFLSSLPGFWVTLPIVLVITLPSIFFFSFRQAVGSIIDSVPLPWILAFEGLRVAAIGGIIKAARGEFSSFYATWIAVPDLLVGFAALVGAVMIARGDWGKRAAIVINVIGFIVIVPFGLVLMNLGLPGPMHTVVESPGLITIFDFPMALAPTVVVPLFVVINLLVAIRLATATEESTEQHLQLSTKPDS